MYSNSIVAKMSIYYKKETACSKPIQTNAKRTTFFIKKNPD